MRYDVCVIGGGPSGIAAAMRSIDLGKKVLLIEKHKVGGAGVFNGALSSKTLWELSENYKIAKSNKYGYYVFDSELDFRTVIGEMHKAENEKHTQIMEQIEDLEKMEAIRFIRGTAKLLDRNTVQVELKDGIIVEYEADNIILAVGSRPRYLPNIPIDEKTIMTSDGISSLEDFPKSIVILGAGVIGCEFATIFSNFGKTKVYLIDKADRILPFEDDDIASMVTSNLEENGVRVHRNSSLKSMEIVDGKVQYVLEYKDGRTETRTVEKALISVGRIPNVENLGLKEVGMKLDGRGFAEDEDTQTSIPNIYAVGDFTADIALVNIAEMEGRYAAERIAGNITSPMHYNNICTIMFLNPEVAGVGKNEQQCRQEGTPYKMALMSYRYVNRAIAKRKTQGFFKILVTDDEDMKILGMRAIGDQASSTIESVGLMIALDRSVHDLANLIFPHPAITEGLQECARMLLGKSIIKPSTMNLHLKCYRFTKEGEIQDLFMTGLAEENTN
ncbi:NAD(P)/FAD-dependent oxidoreductase [bacterium SCSIO 12741]|nr:NAD(P)/FAD-dependent oxidoreductase [bacterium SCSIO 12741]